MSKTIYQELNPAERIQALKDNSYEITEGNVRRFFTEAELQEKKEILSEETILKIDAEEELKKLSAPLKEKIKEKSACIKSVSQDLRLKYREGIETLYLMDDHINEQIHSYDKDGVLQHSRPMTQRERQTKLKIAN